MISRKWTIVISAAVTAAALFGVYGGKQVVARDTPYGSCNMVFDSCSDVPLETLQLLAGLRWESSGSRVVESSAQLNHPAVGMPGLVTGVIELHNVGEGVSLGEGISYPSTAANAADIDEGRKTLKRLGATNVRVLRERDQLVVLRGETKSASLIYVHSVVAR